MRLQYEIQYCTRKSNVVVGTLSRKKGFGSELNNFILVENYLITALQQANCEFEELIKLKQRYLRSVLLARYTIKDELLFFEDQWVVSEIKELKQRILTMFHSFMVAGHGGILKTYKGVVEMFYKKELKNDVKSFMNACEVFQQVKYPMDKPHDYYSPCKLLHNLGLN